MLGLMGYKEGTRQLYHNGYAVQVTFITLLPNRVTQVKNMKRDGYRAIQVTMGQKVEFKVNKSELGHFKKANVKPGIDLWEFPLSQNDAATEQALSLGQELTVLDQFESVRWVDVTAITKGKGFAGGIKRHHFSSQDATHGNSLSHRAPGSIGDRESNVIKGKKMPGQLGNKRRTIQSLEVLAIHPEHHLLVIKGSVPGPKGGVVCVKRAIKRVNHSQREAV